MVIDRVEFVAALARKKMRSYELAEITGISKATISGIRNGKSCSRTTAGKLAEVLGQQIIETRPEGGGKGAESSA